MQAGFGFKPYALAAALDDGRVSGHLVDGSSPQTFAGIADPERRQRDFGMVNLVTATQHSINTAYVNLGPEDRQRQGDRGWRRRSASRQSQLTAQRTRPRFPLGVARRHPVSSRPAAYATFAAEGVHHAARHPVGDRPQRQEAPVHRPTGKRAFSKQVARDATYAMQKVVDAGTGTTPRCPTGNAAGKTGTTSDGKQVWFNGFIPQLAASVGIFRTDNKPLSIPGYTTTAVALPARIWRSYMVQADQVLHLAPQSFHSPSVYTGGGRAVDHGRPCRGRTRP